MQPSTESALLALLERMASALEAQERHLCAIAESAPKRAPGYRRGLSEFAAFDWSSINATVLDVDRDGVAVVEWHGFEYKRRAPMNAFGAAIWFSRAIGKDAEGRTAYDILIKFADSDPVRRASPEAMDAQQAPAPAAPKPTAPQPVRPAAQTAKAQEQPPREPPAQRNQRPLAPSVKAQVKQVRVAPLAPADLAQWLRGRVAEQRENASARTIEVVEAVLGFELGGEWEATMIDLLGVDDIDDVNGAAWNALYSWLRPARPYDTSEREWAPTDPFVAVELAMLRGEQ